DAREDTPDDAVLATGIHRLEDDEQAAPVLSPEPLLQQIEAHLRVLEVGVRVSTAGVRAGFVRVLVSEGDTRTWHPAGAIAKIRARQRTHILQAALGRRRSTKKRRGPVRRRPRRSFRTLLARAFVAPRCRPGLLLGRRPTAEAILQEVAIGQQAVHVLALQI